MIHVVLGTKAQLIKLAPILRRLRERRVPHRLIHTGQHRETMQGMLDEFGLPGPDIVLHRGSDVVSLPQMAVWFTRILARCLLARRTIFGPARGATDPAGGATDPESGAGGRDLVVVHGDTLSALLGAVMGRVAGMEVAHVEAGLTSFDLWNPFPEEITRRLCFRLSHVLYCPGAWAADNVASLGRVVVDTEANTLCDTLAWALETGSRRDHVPDEPYVVASLHRFQNIFKRSRLVTLIEVLEELAERHRVLFILHPPTERQLRRLGLMPRLEANGHIDLRPRYTYFDFVALLRGAAFVATDGGSVQEESSYLGVPCLILREGTERTEGIGENALVSRLDRERIRAFAGDPGRYRRAPVAGRVRPSERIVDSLIERAARARAGGRASRAPGA